MATYTPEHFYARVTRNANELGCWQWLNARKDYYPCSQFFCFAERAVYRQLYKTVKGDFERGLVLDHLCRVKWCVNPDHLEPVTKAENNRRAKLRHHLLPS